MAFVSVAVVPTHFPWLDLSRYRFSAGVRNGDRVWLSGNTASRHDPTTGRVVVDGSMREQAEIAWEKVGAVLAGAELTLAHVSRIVEYVTVEGLATYGDAVAIRAERLEASGAAVSTVVVERLVRPGALLEVEVTASGSVTDADVLYLPTLLGRGPSLAAQVGDVLHQAIGLLTELDLDANSIVATTEFTTPRTRSEYRATAVILSEVLGPNFPAATGVLMSTLPARKTAESPLVALDVTASRQPKRCLSAGPLTFSPAVRAGDLVWVSGTTAIDPRSGVLRCVGDIAGQAEAIYDDIAGYVRALGGRGLADLVKTVEWVPANAMADYRRVGAVRERMLREPLPASTGVGCETLLQPDWLLEVTSLAVVEP